MSMAIEGINWVYGEEMGFREEGTEYNKFTSPVVFNKIDLTRIDKPMGAADVVDIVAPELSPMYSAAEDAFELSMLYGPQIISAVAGEEGKLADKGLTEDFYKKKLDPIERENLKRYLFMKGALTTLAAKGWMFRDMRDAVVYYKNRDVMINGPMPEDYKSKYFKMPKPPKPPKAPKSD